MHLIVVMMLGICEPSIVKDFAVVDDIAAPVPARTVSSQTLDGAEPDAADAASTEEPPPPAPPKATGELTAGEKLFQGAWQLDSPGSNMSTGTLRIDDRGFQSDTIHGSYAGYVTIRSDTSPAQVDFTIENCDCKFDGMTSMGIYYEDDGTIVFAAPAPGEPRPEAFAGLDKTKIMLVRATRTAEGDGGFPF